MKYYTLEETAKILKITAQQVFELTSYNQYIAGSEVIFPSAYFEVPLAITWHKTTNKQVVKSVFPGGGCKYVSEHVELTGYFGVMPAGGGLLTWDERNYAHVARVDCYEEPSWYGSVDVRIHKEQLRISAFDLVCYMESVGIQVPDLLVDEAKGIASTPGNDKELIDKLIKSGQSLNQIAIELNNRGRIPYQIGKLLSPLAGLAPSDSKDTIRKQGERFIKGTSKVHHVPVRDLINA
jgi:hypothetical protein